MNTPLMALDGVSRSFGNNLALNNVNIDVHAGEVHCLLGDNGAGKSTLIKIMSGVVAPDEGRMLLDGQPVSFADPAAANDRRDRGLEHIALPLRGIALIVHDGRHDADKGSADGRPDEKDQLDPGDWHAGASRGVCIATGGQHPVAEPGLPQHPGCKNGGD